MFDHALGNKARRMLLSCLCASVVLALPMAAHAGTARYASSSDTVQIAHDKVTYSESGLAVAADFMASLTLPGADGDLVMDAGDFIYSWNFTSVSPEPSANTMFCGPMLAINSNVYGWLYGNKDGVLSVRSTGGHSKGGAVTLSLDDEKGTPVPVTQMPSAMRIRREGGTLYLEYAYSPGMPFQTGDTMELSTDADSPVSFLIMWSSVDTTLSSIEVTETTCPISTI